MSSSAWRVASLTLAGLALGCGWAHHQPEGAAAAQPRVAVGRQVFLVNCANCHTGEPGAVGPNLAQKWFLPGWVIRYQVRHGTKGLMPAFTEQRVSSAELDAVVTYIHHVRETGAALGS